MRICRFIPIVETARLGWLTIVAALMGASVMCRYALLGILDFALDIGAADPEWENLLHFARGQLVVAVAPWATVRRRLGRGGGVGLMTPAIVAGRGAACA